MHEELEQVRGAHPRLYGDATRIAELRTAVTGSHAPLWRELRELADRAVRSGPPAYRPDDGSSGSEQLWQREVGNTMPIEALAYVISGEPKYLEAARTWALASCSYTTWGLDRVDGMDLAAGHQLFGLGIVYDWCYADLDEAARTTIRETIARRGSAMFQAAVARKTWWDQSYLQNHLWVNACGLAVAGMAVFDEVEDADLWIGFARDKFRRTMDALGSDGASPQPAAPGLDAIELDRRHRRLPARVAGQPVKQVEIERQGTVTTFRSGDRAVSLDWSTSPAKLTE